MSRIVRILRKRGSSGFTLVEMIVSVALLAVLLGGMMLFISPIVRSFNDTKTDLTAENVSTTIQEYLTRSIRNAHQVAVFSYIDPADLENNSAIKSKIQSMNEFCSKRNGDNVIKGQEKYLLKCISLRYEDGKYYLYNENVDMSADGQLSGKGSKVFSDCLYSDLYYTFDIRKTLNQEYGKDPAEPMYRNDALEIIVNAYSNSDYTNLVFYGSGISDLRQIRVMRTMYNQSPDDYNLVTIPDNPDVASGNVLNFSDFDDSHRNIFIFYAVRRLGDASAPTT